MPCNDVSCHVMSCRFLSPDAYRSVGLGLLLGHGCVQLHWSLHTTDAPPIQFHCVVHQSAGDTVHNHCRRSGERVSRPGMYVFTYCRGDSSYAKVALPWYTISIEVCFYAHIQITPFTTCTIAWAVVHKQTGFPHHHCLGLNT